MPGMAVGQSVAAVSHRVRTPPSIVRVVVLTRVSRTVGRVVTALDARAVAGRLHDLDVVLVPEALAALGGAVATVAVRRVVLAADVGGEKPAQLVGVDAPSHYTDPT